MNQLDRYKPAVIVFSFSAILFFGFVALMADKNPVPLEAHYQPITAGGDDAPELIQQEIGNLETTEEPSAAPADLVMDPDPSVADPRSLLRLIAEDKLCDVYLVLAGQLVSRKEEVGILLRSLGLIDHPSFPELTASEAPLFTGAVAFKGLVGQTVVALNNGGFLQNAGGAIFAGQEEVATTQLEKLAREQPENGLYPLFLLAMTDRLAGDNTETLIRIAYKIMEATEFKFALRDFVIFLEANSRASATQWILAQEVIASLPRPDFAKALAVLTKIEDSVPGIKEHLTRIMTTEGLAAQKSYRIGGYDPIQYSEGRNLAGIDLLPSLETLDLQKPQGIPSDFELDIDATSCTPAKLTQLKAKLAFIN